MSWGPKARRRLMEFAGASLVGFVAFSPNFVSADGVLWGRMVEEFAVALVVGVIYAAVAAPD